MNTCLTEHELQALLDGQLSEAEMSSVGNHLAACEHCRQRADDLTNVQELNWSRGRRDSSSESDALMPPRLVEQLLIDKATSQSAAVDLDHELDWLDPPRQEGDLGAMGDYRVLRVLGQGGMGIVLLCHDATLNRLVAVKVLRSDRSDAGSRERFVREARAAAAIQDDNVVTIHQVTNPPNGLPYLVMQYIAGPTLRQQIDKDKQLVTRAAARIAFQIANGLSAAHTAQLVHRDIKPANIILDASDNRAKIMDFGLVRTNAFEKGPRASAVTLEGISPGTPEYMSPEQVDAPRTVDARTDVYGLGVTLYEMLTGTRPFRGPTHAVLQQVLHEDPRPPHCLNPRIPRELETICLHAMEKDPSCRYATAAEMAEDLRRWLDGEAILAKPGGTLRRMVRWWNRHAAFANLAAATVILLLVTSGAMGWQWWRAETYLADARLHRAQRDASAEDARRHREQRDAKAAEAKRVREQRDAKAAEARLAQRQVQEAAGQMLTVALTTQLSQDTRPEALERMVFEKLMMIPDTAIGLQHDGARRPRDIAGAMLLKGGLRRQLGDWEEAEASYQPAIKSLEGLVAESPDDLTLRQMLATAYQGYGEVLHALQQPEAALTTYLKARSEQVRLVEADPRALHYPLDLATSEIAIGNLYILLDQPHESTRLFHLVRGRLRHLQHATSVSLDPRAPSGVSLAYRQLGEGFHRIGSQDDALYCFHQADDIGRKWIQKRPQDWSMHSELGEVQHQLGELYAEASNLPQAAEAFQEAASWQRGVLQSSPLQKEPRLRLVRHLRAATDIHRRLGKLRLAIDAISEVQQRAPADQEHIFWCATQFAKCHASLVTAPTGNSDALSAQLVELAVAALRHATEIGFDTIHDLDDAPEWDSVRDTPQFEALLATASPDHGSGN